jgi:hypothetical protein
MKMRVAYWISTKTSSGADLSQYLLPNEIHLIKSMLNDGDTITGVEKHLLTEEEYKRNFS